MKPKPSIFPRELSSEPVRIGVVGLGYWGPNLIRNLNELDGADLRWICDLDQSRLDTFGKRYPTVRATRDVEDLLLDPELDAVAIATPVSTHYPLGLAALRGGQARVHREAPRGVRRRGDRAREPSRASAA